MEHGRAFSQGIEKGRGAPGAGDGVDAVDPKRVDEHEYDVERRRRRTAAQADGDEREQCSPQVDSGPFRAFEEYRQPLNEGDLDQHEARTQRREVAQAAEPIRVGTARIAVPVRRYSAKIQREDTAEEGS